MAKSSQVVAEISLELDYLRGKLGVINPDGAVYDLQLAQTRLTEAKNILDYQVLPQLRSKGM